MDGKNGKATHSRERQEEWRARIPELRHIIEVVSPAMWEDAYADRANAVPEPWKDLVAQMRSDVHVQATERSAESTDPDAPTESDRRGYYWSFKVRRVADMLEHLAQVIREDLGFQEDNATLASMVLVNKAMVQLDLELQNGGSTGGREDQEENSYRVFQALKALTPRLDDLHLRRLRALQVAEASAKFTHIFSDVDVAQHVEDVKSMSGIDPDRHGDFMMYDRPVMSGVLARQWLAEVDDAFKNLDPLVVLEEFAQAQVHARGGRDDSGDGRVGVVRALARLAVTCDALGYGQRNGEEFDIAVDRARNNLLMTRSRIRKALKAFPGQGAPESEAPKGRG